MRKLITTAVVIALALICTGAMAVSVTITYTSGAGTGAKDNGGTYLVGSSHGFGVTEKWASCDLVQLIFAGADDTIDGPVGPGSDVVTDDVLISETVIGFGRFTDPVNGEWSKTLAGVAMPAGFDLTTHNKVYVRVFDDIKAGIAPGDMYGDSALVAVTSSTTPTTVTAASLVTNQTVVPEPSIMLISGLALLLLRRRKK